jgi:DNA replication protein DnaC
VKRKWKASCLETNRSRRKQRRLGRSRTGKRFTSNCSNIAISPCSKAKVESGVQVVERWIVAALRNRKFFSLAELNQAIRELLVRLNERPFRKRDGSRDSLFQNLEKPALAPLPAERFDMSQWGRATVNIDYHVAFDGNFYSVPYTLVQQVVEVRSTPTTVEIFHRGQRVASHCAVANAAKGSPIMSTAPRVINRIWSGHPRVVNWARAIGPAHGRVVRAHPQRKAAPGDGLSILSWHHSSDATVLSRAHGSRRGASDPRSCLSLSEREVDPEELARRGSVVSSTSFCAAYARQPSRRRLLRPRRTALMLNQPMIEKLLAMRLHGMVEALKAQEQDRAVHELNFLERLALLVDQQWSWRENQALARRLKAAKLKGSACVEDIDYHAARGLDRAVMRALAKDSAWVRNHENIFVIGQCGVGKSFLASALAQKACRDGYSALYLRAAALSRELALARADGNLRHFLARLARIDVLVIDDWAMAPLNETERREVWEICEDRYQTRSTILTSQLPVSRWHEQIGDPTIADGILDRLVHKCPSHRDARRVDVQETQFASGGER